MHRRGGVPAGRERRSINEIANESSNENQLSSFNEINLSLLINETDWWYSTHILYWAIQVTILLLLCLSVLWLHLICDDDVWYDDCALRWLTVQKYSVTSTSVILNEITQMAIILLNDSVAQYEVMQLLCQ